MSGEELGSAPGFLEPILADEFPGLRLDWLTLAASDGPSPPELGRRLRDLASRATGATVVAMRTKPIPRAYRTFFRQIGLDPDTTRIPGEAAAVSRLFHGGYRSTGRLADARLIALVETGVAVWALDADRVDGGGPGIRTARPGERVGDDGPPVAPGTLVVADAAWVHAILFGEPATGGAVSRRTRRILLYAVAVAGVPRVHVDEALWLATDALTDEAEGA